MRWRDQARRGDFDSASDTLQQLVQKEPNDVDSRLALATIYMAQGKLDEAEVILKGLEAKAPQSISIAQADGPVVHASRERAGRRAAVR